MGRRSESAFAGGPSVLMSRQSLSNEVCRQPTRETATARRDKQDEEARETR